MIEMRVQNDVTASVAAAIHAGLGKAVDLSLHAVGVTMIEEIESGPKTGQIYFSGPEPLPHQASAPGEAPANWTGKLVASIEPQMTGETEGEVGAGGGEVHYARQLEQGDPGGRVAPRPFMQPAAEANKQEFIDNVTAAVKEAITG